MPVGAAISNQLVNCHSCITLNHINASQCELCATKLRSRRHRSLQNSMAFLITGIILYIPANTMVIMYTNYLGQKTGNTILGGVVTLWQEGSWPIALIIFVASVLVPVAKIMALSWLIYGVNNKRYNSRTNNMKLYRVTEFIGRWSMVDVFAVAILVTLIQMGNLLSIYPGMATIAFAGMVIATMLSAITFDPRLIWDSTRQRKSKRNNDNQQKRKR